MSARYKAQGFKARGRWFDPRSSKLGGAHIQLKSSMTFIQSNNSTDIDLMLKRLCLFVFFAEISTIRINMDRRYSVRTIVFLLQGWTLCIVNTQYCSLLKNDTRFKYDMYVYDFEPAILNIRDIGLFACLKECLLRSSCTAINYEKDAIHNSLLCRVFSALNIKRFLVPWSDSIVSFADDWMNVSIPMQLHRTLRLSHCG